MGKTAVSSILGASAALIPACRLFTANVATAAGAIVAPSPTLTIPSNATTGYLDLRPGSAGNPRGFASVKRLAFAFFGTRTAADDETFTAKAWGHYIAPDDDGLPKQLFPLPLFEVTVTQGTKVGVSGGIVAATEYFADTITLVTDYTKSTERPGVHIASAGSNQIAWLELLNDGFDFISFGVGTGTNASCNVLATGLPD